MANEAERFTHRWFHNKPAPAVLVLTGVSGSGKSHTAKAVHRFARHAASSAWEQGHWKPNVPSSVFLAWPEIAEELKNGLRGGFEDAIDADLLILDDIGAENDPWQNAVDKLCQLLSRREKRFTLITTNITPEHWVKHFDVRISDRLYRNSEIVDLSQATSYVLL